MTLNPEEALVYREPGFDKDHVYRVFKEILYDKQEYYAKNMKRL